MCPGLVKTCFMPFLVLQPSSQGRKSWLITEIVLWLLCVYLCLSMCSNSLLIGTVPVNFVELDLGCTCTSSVYFDNVTLTSQKPSQYNNKFYFVTTFYKML